jgi:hypothetical protein
MRATKYLLNVSLIVTVLFSGLHPFSPGDLNRDDRLSLEDAILHVMDVARTAGDASAIIPEAENVHSILQILAGIKKDIKSAKEKSLAFFPDLPYLLASNTILPTLDEFSRVPERDFFYESIIIPPASPPPRRV